MSAVRALDAARAAGVEVRVDGRDLVLQADTQPAAEILDDLSRNKAEIIALLRPRARSLVRDDLLALFDERRRTAALVGCTPTKAEAVAFECCLVAWLDQHPAISAPGRCAWCGGNEASDAVVIPFGVEEAGPTWLHPECWKPWHRSRRDEAEEALRRMGIGSAMLRN
jgi:hypothetical protein